MSDIVCQVIDWDSEDVEVCTDEGSFKKFIIRIYGKTANAQTVFIQAENFTPYFFVKIPERMTDFKIKILMDVVRTMVEKKNAEYVDSLTEYDTVKRHIFNGFTAGEEFKFLRLIFNSYAGFKEYEKVFRRPINNYAIGPKPVKYQLYESNILPMLRCLHIRKLSAVGWIRIKAGKYSLLNKGNSVPSFNDINIKTRWTNLEFESLETCVPFKIAVFDIECDSEDGSFPRPERPNDRVIQIGTSFSLYGESDSYLNSVITLGTCDPIPGLEITPCQTERQVLMEWNKLIQRENPDIISGYNIFGFDNMYLASRAKKLGCYRKFSVLGRLKDRSCNFKEQKLASSALGRNDMTYFEMFGRVQFDLMKSVQRDFRLNSYKLDDVASEFVREQIKDVTINGQTSTIVTGGVYGLEVDRFIKIYYNDGLSDNDYKGSTKFKVLNIVLNGLIKDDKSFNLIQIDGVLDGEALEFNKYKVYWSQAKDDVSPQDIFALQRGTSKDRAKLAKYCIQDCILCVKLINKLQIITNNMGMANVCHVPLSFIFLRGQGIKIFSLISKVCREENYLIPVVAKPKILDPAQKLEEQNKKFNKYLRKYNLNDEEEEDDDEGYDGATVFEPKPGVYYTPISVLDYNSLYPQSMRHRNISRETLVIDPKYDNLPDYNYTNVTYKKKDGTDVICRYARKKDGTYGIVPKILDTLLSQRSQTKKQMDNEKDPFRKSVLDGRQLALKVTANSVYGQFGAKTSAVYKKELAASTTATGREMLNVARMFTEIIFYKIVQSVKHSNHVKYLHQMNLLFNKQVDELIGPAIIKSLKLIKEGEVVPRYNYLNIIKSNPDVIDDKKFFDGKIGDTVCYKTKDEFIEWFYKAVQDLLKSHQIKPSVIYGDTDSIFIDFKIINQATSKPEETIEGLKMSITLATYCSKMLNKVIPFPQNIVYEKTFWPFIILSKKRYVGNKYENSTTKYTQNSMGIALKRRDYAPIVKIVVGQIVNALLEDRDDKKAVKFTKKIIKDILIGRYPMEKFIISKTLKGPGLTLDELKVELRKPKEERAYADRTKIVHAVLADRIAERDPGNKPASNDRIQFAYIIKKDKHRLASIKKTKKSLQGEQVETPDYIIQKNLDIDYLFYITNQIMNPTTQFLELISPDANKIFNEFIIMETNRRNGLHSLDRFLTKRSTNETNNNFVNFVDVESEIIKKGNITKKNRRTRGQLPSSS